VKDGKAITPSRTKAATPATLARCGLSRPAMRALYRAVAVEGDDPGARRQKDHWSSGQVSDVIRIAVVDAAQDIAPSGQLHIADLAQNIIRGAHRREKPVPAPHPCQ
jgi:hypothetical protein